MRAFGVLLFLTHLAWQTAASKALTAPFFGTLVAETMLYAPMATSASELPIRRGPGVQKHEQQAALGNTNESAKTNGTEEKQQEGPSEPFLCSDEACGGHVSSSQSTTSLLHSDSSQD